MEGSLRPIVEITENDIKKVTLRFLKHHYRFRPRSVDAFISADMRGMGGVVADGYLAFPRDDGQMFVATFEATSADTRDEVQFSLHKESLLWDAWTFSFLLLTILRYLLHEMDLFLLKEVGSWPWWGAPAAGAVVFAYLYRWMFRSLRRYRYIHAVEQFKQYHADDQWIAIGEDVFPGTEHVYFKELRRQCIKYGFGLIIIDRRFHPQLYITPAREDQFKNRRGTVEFVRQTDWVRQLRESRYVAWLRRQLPWLYDSPKKKQPARPRFRRSHYNQLAVIFFCLLAITGIYYRQWEERPVSYEEQEDYARDREREMRERPAESTIIVVDSAHILPFQKNMRPYMGDIWEEEGVQPADEQVEGKKGDEIIHITEEELVLYDCTRFFNLTSRKYIIQEGFYPDLELASRQMYRLQAEGVAARAIWAGCFAAGRDGYIVYLEDWYNSLQEAAQQADLVQETLTRRELDVRFEIKLIAPQTSNTQSSSQ